ncbi:hypothetical protein Patl1_34672 [Pistacia atlantica]|uniref:Uncharacterized protein n=1 Tax=Pistacia atlantica TaxID=434234 RepID=A0ACC0ZV10_9ROSI|nr:hypothetical protein Patl1_34672 [Pistacia atlantica]
MVIFTARSLEVCGKMGAEKKSRVEFLKHKEAWEFFQKKVEADTLESHPPIR